MTYSEETVLIATPALSVVVIGRNEGMRLVHCLKSVRGMRPIDGEVELIYVDSASTDGSSERAAALGATVLRVNSRRPSAALGRNTGWQRARAPFILFLDGDTILHPTFAVSSLPDFADPQVAVVWGHRRELRPAASIYNEVLDLDWVYPPGPSAFCGGDALFRRSVLEQTGGFDAKLIAGEEPELCRRITGLGYVIQHVDRPMTGHDLAIRHWSQYWRRAVRAGHAYAEVAARFRKTSQPLWRIEIRRNARHAIFLLLLIAVGLGAAAALRSLVPVAVAIAILAVLVGRTALRVGWKAHGLRTRLIYAVHSHLQQIPIFFGQVVYRCDRRAGRRRGLIEYKEAH